MVFTLHWYIFRDLVKTFLLATAVLCLVLGLGSMLRPLRDFSIDPVRVPELLLCTLPVTLTMVIPIAALLAATINYGRLAVDNEITACRSSGINLMTLIYPAAALALLVGTATLLLAFHVIPSFASRIESIVKSDAEAIIYRNIEKKGNVGDLLPRYRIHADEAFPDKHLLKGVAMVKLDDAGQVEQIITAESVSVRFENAPGQNRIRLRLHQWSVVIGDLNASIEDYEFSIPTPSFLRDNVKFKNLDDLKAIREDMSRYSEVRDKLEELRRQYLAESLFAWCNAELGRSGYADFEQPGGRLRIYGTACRYQASSKKETDKARRRMSGQITATQGKPLRVEVFENRQSGQARKFYEAQRGRMFISPQALSPRAILNLETVRWHYANDAKQINLANYDFPDILIPRDTAVQAESLTLDKALSDQSRLLPEPSPQFEGLRKKLRTICDTLQLEIDIEIHSRLAFGVCCVALVLLGAGLGIVFRSGHLLTAFGISCIPTSICLITIFTGKHIAERGGVNLGMGIAFLWSGIAIIMIGNIFLFRYLMRR
jgi:lipopolysaccharide export LptBFGC system permease protein LptF